MCNVLQKKNGRKKTSMCRYRELTLFLYHPSQLWVIITAWGEGRKGISSSKKICCCCCIIALPSSFSSVPEEEAGRKGEEKENNFVPAYFSFSVSPAHASTCKETSIPILGIQKRIATHIFTPPPPPPPPFLPSPVSFLFYAQRARSTFFLSSSPRKMHFSQ